MKKNYVITIYGSLTQGLDGAETKISLHIFTSVCQEFCPRGGGAIPTCIAGGIPACLAAGLQGGGLLRGVCSKRGVCSGGEGVPGGDPPGTATAAGGTHPTGMHSCMWMFSHYNFTCTCTLALDRPQS